MQFPPHRVHGSGHGGDDGGCTAGTTKRCCIGLATIAIGEKLVCIFGISVGCCCCCDGIKPTLDVDPVSVATAHWEPGTGCVSTEWGCASTHDDGPTVTFVLVEPSRPSGGSEAGSPIARWFDDHNALCNRERDGIKYCGINLNRLEN